MNTSRIAVALAALTVTLWGAKAIAIALAGGLSKSPLEGPLFFAGLIAFVATSVALGLALTSGRAVWLRTAACLVAPVLGTITFVIVDSLIGGVAGPEKDSRHWVWTELNLWVGSAMLVAVAVLVSRRSTLTTAR